MIDEAESSTVTKMEMISNETVDVPTSSTEVSSNQTPTTSSRTTNKISREYLIQHITYRAQRLAHKVEAEKVLFPAFDRSFDCSVKIFRQHVDVVQRR